MVIACNCKLMVTNCRLFIVGHNYAECLVLYAVFLTSLEYRHFCAFGGGIQCIVFLFILVTVDAIGVALNI